MRSRRQPSIGHYIEDINGGAVPSVPMSLTLPRHMSKTLLCSLPILESRNGKAFMTENYRTTKPRKRET